MISQISARFWPRSVGITQNRSILPSAVISRSSVCYLGGLARALRVAAIAKDAGLSCVPHPANLSMVTVFFLHMMGAIENTGPYVEFSIGPTAHYPWPSTPTATGSRFSASTIPIGPNRRVPGVR